jgi:lycopene cyclase domain-containing protein
VTYTLLNAVFLAVVALVAVAALLARRAPRWRVVGLTALAVVVISVVFDNLMIGVGLVAYDEERISGIRLGIAPIEDFAYSIAAAVLLPSLWTLLGRRRPRTGAESAVAATVEGER